MVLTSNRGIGLNNLLQYAVALEEKEASLLCWDEADKEVCFL